MKAATRIELESVIAQIEKDARKNALAEVLNKLDELGYLYEQVLTSDESRQILANANGKRFDRLYEQRSRLYPKWEMINRIYGEVSTMLYGK